MECSTLWHNSVDKHRLRRRRSTPASTWLPCLASPTNSHMKCNDKSGQLNKELHLMNWWTALVLCSLNLQLISFTNKAQFDTGFSKRLKIKDNAVPTILDLTVMLQHTSLSNCFYYMITIALSLLTDRLICTEYWCGFDLNHSNIHLWGM